MALVAASTLGACGMGGTSRGPGAGGGAVAAPSTRAERTGYRETSSAADVRAFLDSLAGRASQASVPLRLGVLGRSPAGTEIPYVVAARPMVDNAADAHRSGRPVVYVEANIHAGEVEGKEAVLAIVRELVVGAGAPGSSVLDSIVLVAVPIYNIDGNDSLGSQAVNRPEQNGPERIGRRANGQGLDLNRDFVKAEAPETKGTLTLFRVWDPDVFVDLHTTNGSFHGYALTYAPPLNPAAFMTGPYTADTLLPEVQRRMRERHGFLTFPYGNFVPERGPGPDTVPHLWVTYDHRPRFGTNYVGLRGRIAILSEAYSHDPFDRRAAVTHAFVREILSLVAERRAEVLRHGTGADSAVRAWATSADRAPAIPIRATLSRTAHGDTVLAEDLVATGDSSLTQPGVPRGLRRTGRIHPLAAPVLDRFDPALSTPMPAAYWLSGADTAARRLLEQHGIVMDTVRVPRQAGVERFAIDSVIVAPTLFQGHHEVRLAGRWIRDHRDVVLPAGSYVVPCAQPLGVLATYLLEPLSDDGLATWNVLDRDVRAGGTFPVMRVLY